MADARKELSEFISSTAEKVYFIENENMPFSPTYQKIFKSTPMQGREKKESSALLNVNFQKKIDMEPLKYVDPSSGREIYAKKDIFTAATVIPERLFDGSDIRRTGSPLSNWTASYVMAAMNQNREEMQQLAMDHFNKGGYTAGDPIFNGSNDVQTDPSGNLLYDGVEFLNLASNPRTLLKKPASVATNAFNNCLGSTGKDLTPANFEEAYQKLRSTNSYNDAGNKKPNNSNLILLAHPALRAAALDILNTSSGTPGSVNNSYNPNYQIAELMLEDFLTDEDAWFLISVNGMWEMFDQEAPRIVSWYEEDPGCQKIKVEIPRGSCIKTWQNIVGANVATS